MFVPSKNKGCMYMFVLSKNDASVPGGTAGFFSRAHGETWSGWVARRRGHSPGISVPGSVVQSVHGNRLL